MTGWGTQTDHFSNEKVSPPPQAAQDENAVRAPMPNERSG
jgi:hypothetical protein